MVKSNRLHTPDEMRAAFEKVLHRLQSRGIDTRGVTADSLLERAKGAAEAIESLPTDIKVEIQDD